MTEYGLFSDEGLIEGQFVTPEQAQQANAERYSPEDGLTVAKVCPQHEEQAAEHCEECAEETS